ncbi:hypothetical protein AVEN_264512-1 [Araneus ventricosus]|uniref:Uncharacterized protein n=1 Tax=Araneus ventricosus TaxID=182803 RepID=A0A4Y2JAK3_ARAVE|nr:hypothetical protein AVEN_264512-1 [Araneus ventricosus]
MSRGMSGYNAMALITRCSIAGSTEYCKQHADEQLKSICVVTVDIGREGRSMAATFARSSPLDFFSMGALGNWCIETWLTHRGFAQYIPLTAAMNRVMIGEDLQKFSESRGKNHCNRCRLPREST